MIRILSYASLPEREIAGKSARAEAVRQTVESIIADVRANGDAALRAYAEKFDGATLTSLLVSEEESQAAFASVPEALLAVMRRSAENIEAFHRMQVREGFELRKGDGIVLGQRVTPIARVGLYIPGGTASYPSTVLMSAIPARLAGCKEIVMTSPPGKDGKIAAPILAAARIAGVTRIVKSGGAQAIAALAYGTQSVPRVDKIVGPGNAYVAEAKRQVFGQVAIDMIAGPSEILIVSDGENDPRCLAADLLSQAEHDRLASAVLITVSEAEAKAVQAELTRRLDDLPRQAIARASIEDNGKILLVDSLDAAFDAANRLAPEHLELCVRDPFALLDRVQNAGSIFLGRDCPEPLGDYYAGPNHTLPTMGTARFSSPLSVDDFVKKSSYAYYPKAALQAACADVAAFARAEGLEAHARAIEVRNEA